MSDDTTESMGDIVATIKAFAESCGPLPKGMTKQIINHPDVREVWMHLSLGAWLLTVSFSSDDKKVYIVIREPDRPRQVYHDSKSAVAKLVRHAVAGATKENS